MFQSTQSLPFRSIASLAHLKIHPPLPLTPRESKRLLDLLTTSFRRQLDREHGSIRPEANTNVRASAPLPFSRLETGNHRRHSQSRSDVRPVTDWHLHSILTNPLLRDVKREKGAGIQHLRDPMEIFDEACAKGFMKVEYAAACLKAKKRKILQSSTLCVRDAMRLSGAGSKTLNWMLSSGVTNDSSFLEDKVFSEILVDFLVAEGQQTVIWTWLENLISKFPPTYTKLFATPPAREAAKLLYYLVKAETSESASLDDALHSLGRAEKLISRLRYKFRPVLKKAGVYLCMKIVDQHALRSASSPEIFDLFLSIVPDLSSLGYETALPNLLLYHPTKANANPALNYLERAMKIASTASDPKAQRVVLRANHYDDTRTIDLGLKTAKFLLERGLQSEAHWVMKFLEETYGRYLGLSMKDSFSFHDQAQAEASSLELLNGLSLL